MFNPNKFSIYTLVLVMINHTLLHDIESTEQTSLLLFDSIVHSQVYHCHTSVSFSMHFNGFTFPFPFSFPFPPLALLRFASVRFG